MFGTELVAVDGSKFAGQNNPQRAQTVAQVKEEAARLDKRISGYLAVLDETDAAEPAERSRAGDTRAALALLTGPPGNVAQALQLNEGMDLTQVTLTDPDSRRCAVHGAAAWWVIMCRSRWTITMG